MVARAAAAAERPCRSRRVPPWAHARRSAGGTAGTPQARTRAAEKVRKSPHVGNLPTHWAMTPGIRLAPKRVPVGKG
jgi:hypothetical protein